MSQEFEKCTILKDTDVSYSASSAQQPASAEVSQVRPWGWIADGRLFHLRVAAIEAAEKTPVIDVYTSGQLTRLQAVNAALQARLTVADEQVDILSGGLRLMTSFGPGTNIAGVKAVAKQTLDRAAAIAFNADTPVPK